MNKISYYTVIFAAIVTISHCGDVSTREAEEPTINDAVNACRNICVELNAESNATAVSLDYGNTEETTPPRMAEIHLLSSSGTATHVEPLEALIESGKELHFKLEPNGVRIVLYSTGDLAPLPTGSLFRVHWDSDAPMTVDIDTTRPIFAPPESNVGLKISPPVEIGG